MSIALTSFAVFAASQVGTPGPANMALMATGARYGFRAALPFVAGVALGKQLIIWPIGFGLMELSARAPWVFEALKYISAAYIIWLAWKVANLRLGTGPATDAAPGFAAGLIVHPWSRRQPSRRHCSYARSFCIRFGSWRVMQSRKLSQGRLRNPILCGHWRASRSLLSCLCY
jgi:hypothetical protein